MPLQRGKGLLARLFLRPLLPPAPATFVAPVPGGAVRLQYRELLGYSTLVRGAFEEAEVRALAALADRGSTAVDAGANVGVFSVALGCAVGVEGRVLAFEPVETNFARLRANIGENGLSNVEIYGVALGAERGIARMSAAADPALHSTSRSAENGGTDVDVVPFDEVWFDRRRPSLSVFKIDVEGTEVDVLLGAHRAIAATHPAVLAEAHGPEDLAALERVLQPLGYAARQPPGFRPWNYLFTAPKKTFL